MGEIKKISNEAIESVLGNNMRQYLVGDLKKPQELEYIFDNKIEVGISLYKEFTSDAPHVHEFVTEYQMILQGYSEIKDLRTGHITTLHKGDFFVVEKGTPYAQKSAADTKIIFFKHPGMNDKQLVDVDEATRKWLEVRIKGE